MVVIEVTCCEGCKRFIVQAVWRSCTGFDDVAFVQFQSQVTVHRLACIKKTDGID